MKTQSIISGQTKQLKKFFEDTAEKTITEAKLDKDGLQRLINNGDEFQARIIDDIGELSVSNQFANEEVESSYGYLSGYKPKSITRQIDILRQFFPGIGYADKRLAEKSLPANAEGWFAIPKWQSIAKTEDEAVQKVFDLIKQQRKGNFYNWREGRLGAQYLRQYKRTVKKLETLANQQKSYNILVVAAQFGLRHRGRSVRRAREVFIANEFGLGVFEIGCMLLTHSARLQNSNDLWIDCDNEYADTDNDFSSVPCFVFGDNGVGFGTRRLNLASVDYGLPSAFLP